MGKKSSSKSKSARSASPTATASKRHSASSPSSQMESPNQSATFDLPASLCADPDRLDTADLSAFVPDPAYLEARIPKKDKCRRIMRRVFWSWKIHTVASMFDTSEIIILNSAGLAVAGAISLYCASTIASFAF